MTSPTKPAPKKGGAADPDDPITDVVALSTAIKSCFESVFGTEGEMKLLDEEYFNLINHDKIRLQQMAPIFEARRIARQKRKEQRKKEDEERRLLEKRNNAENLAHCAKEIQKMFRGWKARSLMDKLRTSLRDRSRKRAIVFIVDRYEDKRVRPLGQAGRDAMELCRAMQLCGFHVDLYSSHSPPHLRPTKANFTAVIQEASADRGAEEGVLWVHVCGCGGVATVSGKNPHKQQHVAAGDGAAAGSAPRGDDPYGVVTPRTRLMQALKGAHGSHQGSGGAGSAVGDQCHYVLPCDARSTRLSFDTVVSLDDVADILTVRAAASVYRRSTLQRIVTVEVAPLGQVEGTRGGGFGFLASTVTSRLLVEYPTVDLSPTSDNRCIEPHRSIFTHALNRAFAGVGWAPIPIYQRVGKSRIAFKRDSTISAAHAAIGDADAPGLTAAQLFNHVTIVATEIGLTCETSGRPWGDFTIIAPERGAVALAFVDKAYGTTTTTSVAATTAGESSSAYGGSAAAAVAAKMRRKRHPATLRQVAFGMTIRVNVSKKEQRINTYDNDFWAILSLWIQLFAQTEPTSVVARQSRVTLARSGSVRRMSIGIGATFVEISSRCKARGIADVAAYAEVVDRLTKGRTTQAAAIGAKDGGASSWTRGAGGMQLPSLKRSASIVPGGHASSKDAEEGGLSPDKSAAAAGSPPAVGASDGGGVSPTTHPSGGSDAGTRTPAAALLGSSPSSTHHSNSHTTAHLGFLSWVGKHEEGLVVLVVDLHSQEEVNHALQIVDTVVPEVLCGASVTNVSLDFQIDCHATLSAFEQMRLTSRGATVSLEQIPGTAGINHPSIAHAVVAPSIMPAAIIESQLTQAVTALPQTPRKASDWISRIAGSKNIKILDVEMWMQRVNDLDDSALDTLMRRERSTGTACHATHTGVALCLLATAAPPDQRLRQCAEFAPFVDYEVTHAVRCLVWDLNDSLRPAGATNSSTTNATATDAASSPLPPPTATATSQQQQQQGVSRRERIHRLLESVRDAIPAANFPALILLDLFKKRYYRCAMLPGATAYSTAQIGHFIDAFVKGSLNELLPPVKGCRVYGGSVSRSKYSLIAV